MNISFNGTLKYQDPKQFNAACSEDKKLTRVKNWLEKDGQKLVQKLPDDDVVELSLSMPKYGSDKSIRIKYTPGEESQQAKKRDLNRSWHAKLSGEGGPLKETVFKFKNLFKDMIGSQKHSLGKWNPNINHE